MRIISVGEILVKKEDRMDNGASSYRHFLMGDEKAFSEIIDLYEDNLIFFINRTIGNLSVSEEIAAECFAELIVHKGRYNGKVSFKTYLFTIGHHKMVSYIRHHSLFKQIPLDDAEESEECAQFEEQVIRDEEKRLVHEALDKLNPDYRQVLHLLYFEDMTYDEAAAVMKKSHKQIDNMATRARKALREIMEKEGFEYEK